MEFDNGIKIEILTDTLKKDYEHYRLVDLKNDVQYKVRGCNDKIICEFQ